MPLSNPGIRPHLIRDRSQGLGWILLGDWWSATPGAVTTGVGGFVLALAAALLLDEIAQGERWALVVLIVLIFVYAAVNALRHYAVNRAHQHEVDRLITTIQEVRDEALLMPPEHFLEQYQRSYKRIQGFADSHTDFWLASPDEQAVQREDIARSIRSVLDMVLNLAWIWDRQEAGSGSIYRANIMRRRPASELASAPNVVDHVEAGLRHFSPAMVDELFSKAPAFVALDRDLTTNSRAFEEPESDDLEPLAFPVFAPEHQYRINVPGAAAAAATVKPSYVGDIEAIARDIDARKGFDAQTRRNFGLYYREDPKARSVLSLPICQYDPHGEAQAIFGVLNIYANRRKILGSEQRAVRFAMLCGPLLSALGTLVDSYWLAEQAERGTQEHPSCE